MTQVSAIAVEVARPAPPPVESTPSQRPAPPVIPWQKSARLVPYVPKRLSPLEIERFGNVDVALDVAVKFAATTSPTTESFAYGEVVPMPTVPLLRSDITFT